MVKGVEGAHAMFNPTRSHEVWLQSTVKYATEDILKSSQGIKPYF